MYNKDIIGPSIEPCGTPLCNSAYVEHKFSMQTEIDLPFKHDLNQSKAVTLMPTSSKCHNKMQ